MKRWEFYREWARRSFAGPYAVAELAGFILAIIGGAVSQFVPQVGPTVSLLLWAVPLALFGLAFIWAWLAAPYDMHRDLVTAHAVELAKLAPTNGGRQRRKEIAEMLGRALGEGTSLFNRKISSDQEFAVLFGTYDTWLESTCRRIREAISETEELMFKAITSRRAADYIPSFNQAHNDLKGEMHVYLDKLRALYQRYAD